MATISIATQAILVTAEKGINKLLEMDSNALEQLTSLAGKTIAIQSTTPAYRFFVNITEQGLYLSTNCDTSPDSEITATIPILLRLLVSHNKQSLLVSSNIALVGNTALTHSFCKIFDDLNLDWQYELSKWFSPAIASLMIRSFKVNSEQLQAKISIAQLQLATLFEKLSTTTISRQVPPSNPISELLGLLQKKFGQS